ncbi:MAG: hypothetical protein A49_14160 [Methyloceanibacter sp.]|nr:MAG: hypothetical protein A49_14160 [Methyloceanibacter sp.]
MLRAERNAALLKNAHDRHADPVFRDAVIAARGAVDAAGSGAIDESLMVWTMKLVCERNNYADRRRQ